MAHSSVRFVEGLGRILSELEVETVGHADLTTALTETLFHLRIQIVRFQFRRLSRRIQARLAIVEFDGGPITLGRRAEVQAAVLSSLEGVVRGPREVRRVRSTVSFALEATS